jgi:TatD DNase family protein
MKYDIHTHNIKAGKNSIFANSTKFDNQKAFSVGIHPWELNEAQIDQIDIFAHVKDEFCLAIGEIGLDRIKGPNLTVQTDRFCQQIALSEEHKLPVIIPCVRAFEELIQLKRILKPAQPWIVHGFEKTAYLNKLLETGFYISIGHRVLTNEKLQSILPKIPFERLFLETDESSINIDVIYDQVAQLLYLPLHQLEKQIEINIKRVFPKWKIG